MVVKANIRVAKNPMMNTIAYLSLNQSSLSVLKGTIIGSNAASGMKYLVLIPRLKAPTSAHVRSWMKHVPTYMMSTMRSEPNLALLLNSTFLG